MGYESLINAISRQPGLEELADVLQKAVRAAFPGDGGREAKNLLHGTWLGHPLHPAITDVPLGAWTLALVPLVEPAPRVDHALPSHFAIRFAGAPPAAMKAPPT